jgi:hypothetical protein
MPPDTETLPPTPILLLDDPALNDALDPTLEELNPTDIDTLPADSTPSPLPTITDPDDDTLDDPLNNDTSPLDIEDDDAVPIVTPD